MRQQHTVLIHCAKCVESYGLLLLLLLCVWSLLLVVMVLCLSVAEHGDNFAANVERLVDLLFCQIVASGQLRFARCSFRCFARFCLKWTTTTTTKTDKLVQCQCTLYCMFFADCNQTFAEENARLAIDQFGFKLHLYILVVGPGRRISSLRTLFSSSSSSLDLRFFFF